MNPLLHLDLGAPVSYLAAFLLPALDAIAPLVPSESAVITVGWPPPASSTPGSGSCCYSSPPGHGQATASVTPSAVASSDSSTAMCSPASVVPVDVSGPSPHWLGGERC